MSLSSILLLCLILLQTSRELKSESYQSRHKAHQPTQGNCEVYAQQAMKPMMIYLEQVHQNIGENNGELKYKNNRIKQLEEQQIQLQREVSQLRIEIANCSFKDKVIKLLEEKDESNVQLIKSLQEQLNLLTKLSKNQVEEQSDQLMDRTAEIKIETEKLDESKDNIKLKKDIDNARSCISQDSTGVHKITLSHNYSFYVLCNSDIAGPGWTVIQQRINGRVEFQRDWATYRDGFGAFWDGDFFLGLEKIHRLTSEQPHELYIHMERFNGSTFFARYNEFAIAGEDDHYRLSKLGEFFGTTTDQLSNHKNMKFTTYDRDNDNYSGNCATDVRHGGWWYNGCAQCNLNGKFFLAFFLKNPHGNFWHYYPIIKQVKIMIRPKAA